MNSEISTTNRRETTGRSKQIDSRIWRYFLEEETSRMSQTGTRAAVLSLQVHDLDGWAGRPVDLLLSRFLERSLQRTDRYCAFSSTDFSILQAPAKSFQALLNTTRQIEDALTANRFEVSLGYAMQRKGEELPDTLARADAEAHRLQFRRELSTTNLFLR